MKKFITLLFIASVVVLTSCGNNTDAPATEATKCDSTACADTCKATETATAVVTATPTATTAVTTDTASKK